MKANSKYLGYTGNEFGVSILRQHSTSKPSQQFISDREQKIKQEIEDKFNKLFKNLKAR